MERLAAGQGPLRQGQLSLLRDRSPRPRLIRLQLRLAIALCLLTPAAALAGPYPAEIEALGASAVQETRSGKLDQAIPLWQALNRWQRQHLGDQDERTLRSLHNLGAVYLGSGHPRQAADAFAEHLQLVERRDGAHSLATAAATLDLAKALRSLAQFDQAQNLTRRSLAILQSLTSTAGTISLRGDAHELLGVIAHEQGLYALAEQEHRQALNLRRGLPDAPVLGIASSLANVAQALVRQGHFAQALALQQQALALYRSQKDQETRGHQATVLANIGLSQDLLGNSDAALAAMQEALPIRLSISGSDHPETARLLLNLGALEVATGSLVDGLAHQRQALATLERRMGPQHISTAFALQRMAEVARALDQPDNALAWYQRTLAIRRDQLRPDHPDIATTLLGMALVEHRLQQTPAAMAHLQEALRIRLRAFGPDHPYTALTRLLLALQTWQDGRHGEAQRQFRAVGDATTRFLLGQAALLPTGERRRFLATIQESRNVLYGLSLQGPVGAQIALEARINLQGRLEEIERRQMQLLRRSPANQASLAMLSALTEQLTQPDLTAGERQQLTDRRTALERQLFLQLQQSSAELTPVSSRQIARAIPDDGVLLEFLRFEPIRLQSGMLRRVGESRYGVLVLERSGQLNAIDLGPAQAINEAIWRALNETQRIGLDSEQAWSRVETLLLQPVLPLIASKRVWFISPDSELHRIPFAVLGDSSQGPMQRHGDQHRIRLLTSARDLLAESDRRQFGPSLVLADPNFDARITGQTASDPTGQSRGADQSLPDQWRSLRWQRLPGTRAEGMTIHRLLGGTLALDDQAVPRRLQEASSPRILHLATHGSFLPRPYQTDDGSDAQRMRALEGHMPATADPMLRGVVLLAGANRATSAQEEDGIVTALELSLLNLDGTELVTLSACDTGTGAIELGEGVYGLRRGIAVAGARSSLLSLWKVDDLATAKLMEAFYASLAQDHSPEEALLAAQAMMRENANLNWRHPYYWASFQLYGQSWKQ